MAVRTSHVTTRSANYSLGPGADLSIARVVALLLLLLPLAAWFIATREAKAGPSDTAVQLANFDPKKAFADNTPHFLPKPVAALPADNSAGPPAPAAADPVAANSAERVKVANTGGAG